MSYELAPTAIGVTKFWCYLQSTYIGEKGVEKSKNIATYYSLIFSVKSKAILQQLLCYGCCIGIVYTMVETM